MARITADPVNTSLALPSRRRRGKDNGARVVLEGFDAPAAPPPAEPDPEPAAASPGFAAAMLAEQLPAEPLSSVELRKRFQGRWQPPASDLRLTNRRI